MRKTTLLIITLLVATISASAATSWLDDYLTIKINGTTPVANNYYIGSTPSLGTSIALQGTDFGTVTSLEIIGCEMKYSSDTQDRTGGSFFYKIMAADGTTEVLAPVETVWTQTGPVVNDYQGTTTTTINITNGVLANGTYRLQVWAKSLGSDGESVLNNSNLNYVATFTVNRPVIVTGANGITDNTSYNTLKGAFDAINAQADQTAKNIEIKIAGNTTETATAALNQPTTASWTSLTIYPTATATISGSFVGTILDLNGADNVTINGKLNKTGAVKSLTISHTSNADNGNRTIRIWNDAKNNIIQYATITGKCPSTGAGVIFFSTTSGTDGNDGNIIEYNDINAMGEAAVGIGSAGTASPKDNSGNIIRYNNIYDFFLGSVSTNSTYGINIGANNTDWTITGNRLYQTATRAYIATGTTYTFHYGIYISASTGNNFVITDNYIGGSSSDALNPGTWTITGLARPVGLYTSVGTTTATSIQNNTIANFDITTGFPTNGSSAFIGYWHNAGTVNVGTVTGNTIGSTTSTGSIVVKYNSAAVGALTVGINIVTAAAATQIFSNNKIGGIIADYLESVNRGHLYAVSASGAGALTFTNNLIGSETVLNSIEHKGSTYASGQFNLRGITMGNTVSTTLTGNTIANLSATSTGNATINGIFHNGAGANNISNNTIRDLKCYGNRAITTQGIDASLIGIVLNNSNVANIVGGNTIYNLENTNTSVATDVYGINFHSINTSISTIEKNTIYNLKTASTNTAANVVGISITRGFTETRNNMISIGNGITNAVSIIGISKTSTGTNTVQLNNFYHNTVLITGDNVNVAGSTNTAAFRKIRMSNDIVLKNNILINNRSNATGNLQKHYVIKLDSVTTFTSDYNVAYHPGVGGLLGVVGATDYADLAAWKTSTSLDAASKSKDVEFVSATDLSLTGTSINDAELGAPRLTGIVDKDILSVNRAATTYMGAYEASDLTIPAPTKAFTVTVPNGTSKVYVTGTFTGKKWNITAPHELLPTSNPNEFTGTFACANDVAYKYLCETADMDYQAAVSAGGLAESNRSYTAADVVTAWLNMKTVKLNVSFSLATAVPSQLFVKGSWDTFATPIELTKSGNTFSTTLSGILSNKIPANTQYKFYTNDMNTDNWESNADNSFRTNRWTIYPVMNDEIARFTTQVFTSVDNVVANANILRTNSGIKVILNNPSAIELYSANGVLIEKTNANGIYSRILNNGVYIININGKATKFVK